MSRKSEFHDYVVHDLLEDTPGITSRAMFSGYGIYRDKKIFAIIAEGELYFKANVQTKSYFEKFGSVPFTYTKKDGKSYTMSYWLVPEEVMENRDTLAEWVEKATT